MIGKSGLLRSFIWESTKKYTDALASLSSGRRKAGMALALLAALSFLCLFLSLIVEANSRWIVLFLLTSFLFTYSSRSSLFGFKDGFYAFILTLFFGLVTQIGLAASSHFSQTPDTIIFSSIYFYLLFFMPCYVFMRFIGVNSIRNVGRSAIKVLSRRPVLESTASYIVVYLMLTLFFALSYASIYVLENQHFLNTPKPATIIPFIIYSFATGLSISLESSPSQNAILSAINIFHMVSITIISGLFFGVVLNLMLRKSDSKTGWNLLLKKTPLSSTYTQIIGVVFTASAIYLLLTMYDVVPLTNHVWLFIYLFLTSSLLLSSFDHSITNFSITAVIFPAIIAGFHFLNAKIAIFHMAIFHDINILQGTILQKQMIGYVSLNCLSTYVLFRLLAVPAFVYFSKEILPIMFSKGPRKAILTYVISALLIIILFGLAHALVFLYGESSYYNYENHPRGLRDFFLLSAGAALRSSSCHILPAHEFTKGLYVFEGLIFLLVSAFYFTAIIYAQMNTSIQPIKKGKKKGRKNKK